MLTSSGKKKNTRKKKSDGSSAYVLALSCMVSVLSGFIVGTEIRGNQHEEDMQKQINLTENLEQYLYDAHCDRPSNAVKYKGIDVSHVVFKRKSR